MAEYVLDISTNPAALLDNLFLSIRKTMDFISLGFNAVEKVENIDRKIPESYFQLMSGQNKPLDMESLKKEFKSWQLKCCFRDCVESIHVLLEGTHWICKVWSLEGKLTGEQWEKWKEKYERETKKFHKLFLPDKIKCLHKIYPELTIPDTTELKSINKARNCLVHRSGVVTERDSSLPDGLLVQWFKPGIRVTGLDGATRVITIPPPPNVAKGEICDMRSFVHVKTQKLFKLGEAIDFNANEFCEICWTLFEFGREFVESLESYGNLKGIPSAR